MKDKRQKLYRAGLLCSLLLLCACLASSCISLGEYPPPGFAKEKGALRTELPEDSGADVAYALLNWHIACSPSAEEHAAPLEAEFSRLCNELFVQQSEQSRQKFAPLVRLDDGMPVLEPGVVGQGMDSDKARTMLNDIISLYSTPASVQIPIDKCTNPKIWRRQGRKKRESFLDWAKKKKSLVFQEPTRFSRKKIVTDAQRMIKLLDVRESILKVMDGNPLSDDEPDRIVEALNSAERIASHLEQGLSLDELGCAELQRKFLEFKANLPLTYVMHCLKKAENALSAEKNRLHNANLKYDETTIDVLGKLENFVSSALNNFQNDARFKTALISQNARIDDLLMKMGTLRCDAWSGSILELGRQQRYWEAYLFYLKCVEQIAASGNEGTLAAYARVMHKLSASFGTLQAMHALLPDAVKKYAEASRQALEIANNPAIAYAICSMMNEICSIPVTNELAALRKDAAAQLKHAREKLLSTAMRRYFSLGEMPSAIPGIGVTYRLDLENELLRLLNAFGLGDIVLLQENNDTTSKPKYFSRGGNVANFEGKEIIERKKLKAIIRLMESSRVENPDYVKGADDTQNTQTSTRIIFQQEEVRQIIHVREIERLAHVRAFLTFIGPGFNELIESNEFYSKFFKIEESHPVNDVHHLRTKNYYAENEVPKPSAEPQLVYDRVWTEGQLLDWARKDSITAMALPMFYYINGFTLFLKDKVESDASLDIAKKTELWAKCSLLCDLQKEGDETELLNSPVNVIAKIYANYVDLLRKQRKQIFDLRSKAAGNMRQAAYEYVQRKEVQ